MKLSKIKAKNVLLVLLIYTVIVILWGAWVRISHSGDGCGDTWPLCNGKLIPLAAQKKTWVEYTHRAMSGLYGIIVFVIFLFSRKLNSNHPSRKWCFWMLIFTISEALLGAKLVLFGLVGSNSSALRAFVMALHLLNSLVLVMTVTLAYLGFVFKKHLQLTKKTLLLFAAIAMTGAWASLSNTLFPSASLLEGIKEDFNQNSHFLLRLRLLHPLLAIGIASYLLKELYRSLFLSKYSPKRQAALWASAVIFLELVIGMSNLVFHAPISLKLLHLTLAHMSWILLIFWVTAPSKTSDT